MIGLSCEPHTRQTHLLVKLGWTTQPSNPQRQRGRMLQNAKMSVLHDAFALADAAGYFIGAEN